MEQLAPYIKDESGGQFLDAEKIKPIGEYDQDTAVEQWGTKWPPEIHASDDGYILCDSAWSPPSGIIKALSEKLNAALTCSYHEPGMSFCGAEAYNRGEFRGGVEYEMESKEGIAFLQEEFPEYLEELEEFPELLEELEEMNRIDEEVGDASDGGGIKA